MKSRNKYLIITLVVLLKGVLMSCSESEQELFPPFFYVDEQKVEVSSTADSVKVGVATNLEDWFVEVKDSDWITVKKHIELGRNFAIVYPLNNMEEVNRSATITFKGNGLEFDVIIEQGPYIPPLPPGYEVLRNEVAGGLQVLLENYDKESITNLTLSGIIDYRDLLVLREMLLEESLTDINLEDAQIVAYGQNPANMIPNHTFTQCPNLKSIILPNTLEVIGSDGFSYNEGLVSIVIPNSVKELKQGVFYNCKNLENVVMSNSLEKIGRYMFGNSKVKRLDIPSTLEEFFDLFWANNYLEEVNIHKDHPTYNSIDGVITNKGFSKLIFFPPGKTEFDAPAVITEIESGAFHNKNKLIKLSLPGLKTLSWSTFINCSSLESVTLDNLEEISDYAFDGKNNNNLKLLDLSKARNLRFIPSGPSYPLKYIPIYMTPELKENLMIKVATQEIKNKFDSEMYPNVVVGE